MDVAYKVVWPIATLHCIATHLLQGDYCHFDAQNVINLPFKIYISNTLLVSDTYCRSLWFEAMLSHWHWNRSLPFFISAFSACVVNRDKLDVVTRCVELRHQYGMPSVVYHGCPFTRRGFVSSLYCLLHQRWSSP